MSELRRIDGTLWEIPTDARPDMRVPARLFADDELLAAIRRDRSLEQLAERRDAPRASSKPRWRCRTSTGATASASAALPPPSCRTASSRPAASATTSTAASACSQPRSRATSSVAAAKRSFTSSRGASPPGAGRGGPLDLAGASARPSPRRRAARARLDARDRNRGGRRAHRVGRLPGRRRSGGGVRARQAAGTGTAGHGRLGKPLRRGAARGSRSSIPRPQPHSGFGEGQVTFLIHSGSRGLGHQVCTDHVRRMDAAHRRYGIELPDRQLACAPASSPEGEDYLRAMAAAANFAWCNRHAIAHRVREAVAQVVGGREAQETRQVYDVAHNVAKPRVPRRARRPRPPQGRDARLPGRAPGHPPGLRARRAAGLHPRQHGDEQLRARRRARVDGPVVRHHLPRRRSPA